MEMGVVEIPVWRTRRFAFVTPAARIRAAQSRKMAGRVVVVEAAADVGVAAAEDVEVSAQDADRGAELEVGPRRQRAAEGGEDLGVRGQEERRRSLLP